MNTEEKLLCTLRNLRCAESEDEILSSLIEFSSQFGFEYVYISQFLDPGSPLPSSWVSANNWPSELLERRRTDESIFHDPVIRMGLHAHCPFDWQAARDISGDEGRRVMDVAAEYNIKAGMMFPLRMVDLPPGGVSMGGAQFTLSRLDQNLLEMAARESYFRLLEVAGPLGIRTGTRLSRRESQILTMVAEGHNNQSVAHDLGICADTVKDTLKRCYRKLGVRNRSAAVKQALMTLQILPLPNDYPPPKG